MKIQTIINCVFAVVIISLAVIVVAPRDATFETITCNSITCNGWHVVDKDGKLRIMASVFVDGASMVWLDKDTNVRIDASTHDDGSASVLWKDKEGKMRISTGTLADGQTGVVLLDKNGKARIAAVTLADETVILPTEDLTPPKKP